MKDVAILFIDGLWTHRVGGHFFPDSPKFNYSQFASDEWVNQLTRYESDTREYWFQHYNPKKGDVIIDVGAGRGEDTFTFSRAVGPTGRVVAIEAHPASFAILRNFCHLNGLHNVTPLHLALMDSPGTVAISESASSWMENTITSDHTLPGVTVQAETLDHIVTQQELTEIAFLKMNIEGAERFALSGMQSTIGRIHQICIACHDFRAALGHGQNFRTRDFVEKFLVQNGFTLLSRPHDSRDYVRDHVFGVRS